MPALIIDKQKHIQIQHVTALILSFVSLADPPCIKREFWRQCLNHGLPGCLREAAGAPSHDPAALKKLIDWWWCSLYFSQSIRWENSAARFPVWAAAAFHSPTADVANAPANTFLGRQLVRNAAHSVYELNLPEPGSLAEKEHAEITTLLVLFLKREIFRLVLSWADREVKPNDSYCHY